MGGGEGAGRVLTKCIPLCVTRNCTRIWHSSASFRFRRTRRSSRRMRAKKDPRLISKSEKPRALNLQLHTRVYLLSYVRYLCRTKSHLCRSQNKLLIIEIRRISRRYVNGLHTVDEARRNHTSSYRLLSALERLREFCNPNRRRRWTFIEIVDHSLPRIYVVVDALISLSRGIRKSFNFALG